MEQIDMTGFQCEGERNYSSDSDVLIAARQASLSRCGKRYVWAVVDRTGMLWTGDTYSAVKALEYMQQNAM